MRLSTSILTLLLCLSWISSFGQTQCDTIKRLAATWVIQRNECREALSLAEQEIIALRASDSLTRLEAERYRSAASILGQKLVESDQERKDAEAQADKYRQRARRRLWLLPIGIAVGVVLPLVL
jgi:hypothetical protein